MIQRKQTLWLALIVLICISSVWLNIPFREIEGQLDGKVIEDALARIGFSHTEITIAKARVKNQPNTFLKYTVWLIALVAAASVFLYKQRNRQLILGKILYGLVVVMVFFMYYYGWSERYVDIQPDSQIIISALFPLVIAWANYKANSGIQYDESLVKSYDRLR